MVKILYQKLLMGSKPYFISVGSAVAFEMHRHPEIELSFCILGEYDIICENKRYTLKAGDLAVIPPMAAHEIPQGNGPCSNLTVEVGHTLLGEFFEAFTSRNMNCTVYKKTELHDTDMYMQLTELLEETAVQYKSGSEFSELCVKGNLYRISALLLQSLRGFQEQDTKKTKRLDDIRKIDKALDIIYSKYCEQLTVDAISAVCGYSKSNFCKIFKSVTGDTFHSTLNRHRTEIACILLRDSGYTVDRIAQETGFSDTKSFCRVFKKIMGVNAGEYRKRFH